MVRYTCASDGNAVLEAFSDKQVEDSTSLTVTSECSRLLPVMQVSRPTPANDLGE